MSAVSKIIIARGPHTCPGCSKRLPKGASIWFCKGLPARCVECGPQPDAPSNAPIVAAKPKRKPQPWPVAEGDPQFGTYYRMSFDSVADVVRCAFSDVFHGSDKAKQTCERHLARCTSGKHDWTNFATRESIEDALICPPAELLATLDRIRQQIIGQIAPPRQARRHLRRGQDHGDAIDADRFLAKDSYCWERSERQLKPSGVLRLGINAATSANDSGESLLARGAAAVVLADLLTEQGNSVELVLLSCVSNASTLCQHVVCAVTVKPADQPLDVGAVAYATCAIEFYRACVMTARARRVPGANHPRHGTGTPRTIPLHVVPEFDFVIDRGHIVDIDSAIDFINAAVVQSQTV